MNIGHRIRAIRTWKNIPVEVVAERLNIDRTTLYKYETGHRQIKIKDLPKFAKALEVDVSLLIEENVDNLATKTILGNEIERRIQNLAKQANELVELITQKADGQHESSNHHV